MVRLGSILILMLLIFVNSLVLLIGFELNEHHRIKTIAAKKEAKLNLPAQLTHNRNNSSCLPCDN
jgi:uncharacterized BrkB/YihY/UPF0761 family membrane protein